MQGRGYPMGDFEQRAADISVGPQTREQFNELAGPQVAAAAFGAGAALACAAA